MNDHPVWNVYDELRTAKLNVCYYRSKLALARQRHTARELVMATSASTGAAGLWLFSAAPTLWKILASTAALIALYHSVTRPTDHLRKLETHVVGWTQLAHLLADLRRRIHEAGRYDESFQREAKAILDTKLSLVPDLAEPDIDMELRDRCFAQVNRELPPEVFFVPNS